jgi:hypothetical protein
MKHGKKFFVGGLLNLGAGLGSDHRRQDKELPSRKVMRSLQLILLYVPKQQRQSKSLNRAAQEGWYQQRQDLLEQQT